MAGPVASTSAFKGFGPPAWIFSFDGPPAPAPAVPSLAHAIPLYAPPTKSHSGISARPSLDDEAPDEDASYGPTLKRRGNVRFVRAKLAGVDEKGKGRERDAEVPPVAKGEMVRGLYESIVGPRADAAASSSTPPATAVAVTRHARPSPDVDLTLDDSDDDLVILDPTTGRAEAPPLVRIRPPRRRNPAALLDLILPPTAAPLVPPLSYGIKPNNIGWRMLAKQGWKEGEGLGPADVEARGLKVPLKASDKFDKKGLGVSKEHGERSRKRVRELEEVKRREDKQRERDSRGGKVAAKRSKRDADSRRELLAYLNS